MPIYEYYCSDCQATFSALRPIAQSDALIVCPQCDNGGAQRVLSLFAFHMAGSTQPRSMSSQGGCGCGGGGCGCGAY